MSRLNDLLRELRNREPVLARDLEREVTALNDRRAFGLNFERHIPEAVELPGRPVRKGDKVRVLPQRGKTPKKADEKVWRVVALDRAAGKARLEAAVVDAEGGDQLALAKVEAGPENITAAVDDLVVVAGFRDAIYPGLVSTGKVERGGDKPFHTVINAENYHALETLLFTHRGKVDVIYIDPPYNTRDRDWKYNNDYVNADDLYRHSKWLAFMERRLLLAKELLNPDGSVLLVTIDEKERNRLGLLLEQVFPGVDMQTITSVINPKGASLGRDFARVDEQIYVLYVGGAGVQAQVRDMLDEGKNEAADTSVKWSSLIRGGAQGIRTDSPGAYYPVLIDVAKNVIHSFGTALPWDQNQDDIVAPPGTVAVWPPRHTSGVEGRWGIGPEKAAELYALGALRLGKVDASSEKFPLSYLSSGIMEKVASGEIITEGRRPDGTLLVRYPDNTKVTQPKTVWKMPGHNAGEYGSKLVTTMLPGRKFPFPKALYAVEDALRFFVADRPDALVVDFFAGSGTTTHAVMRLNRQDGGRRRSISVTNNEVAPDEHRALRQKGLRPGDVEWERWGICEYITKPRIAAAMTGRSPDGEPIRGDYKFTDEFSMAEGFQENVEFFTLTYEAPLRVASHREFTKIAPLLWIRAGSRGRRIDDIARGWDVADVYGVLANIDHVDDFMKAVTANPLARRIPGDERLNAVDCILPFFDRTTAVKVVRFLTGDLESMPGAEKKTVIDGKELLPNPNVPKEVWKLWETLPTQTLPQRGARPMKRLVALAQALSADGVMPGALADVDKKLHRLLDGFATIYKDDLDKAIQEVWDVHVKEIEGRFGKKGLTFTEFVERADDRAIRTGFDAAKKAFGGDVAQAYVNHLAGRDDEHADDDGLRKAYVRAAALATVKEVRDKVDAEALELTKGLFARHRVAVLGLSDARQQEYENIRAMATEPERGVLKPPRTRIEGFSVEEDEKFVPAPTVSLHMMSDADGQFPLTSLDSEWEREVVHAELRRPNARGWYRNPSRAAVDSLGIAYRDDVNGNWRSMHPDFVFFHEVGGKVVASIVDPHSHHLDDALMKLKALAHFAENYGDAFHRIEALDRVDGHMRVLDMKSEAVREEVIFRAQNAVDVYRSTLAVDYDSEQQFEPKRAAKMLPFRRVTPKPEERWTTCVPFVELAAAAGTWGPSREGVPELSDTDTEWITWDDAPRFTKDMFVARVRGRSMEPVIADGAACLFRRVDAPSSPERAVLVRHGGTADPETGGAFTVKRYRSAGGRAVLEPANPGFAPLVLSAGDEVRVIAEVVKVLG